MVPASVMNDRFNIEVYTRNDLLQPQDLLACGRVDLTGYGYTQYGPLAPASYSTGPQGPWGPKARKALRAPGDPGMRGSRWYTGPGAPDGTFRTRGSRATCISTRQPAMSGAGSGADLDDVQRNWCMSWTAETNIKGPKGDKGDVGPIGPPGQSGTGTGNVVGPAGAVADRIATYNGTSGTVIKDGGKLISDLALTTAVPAPATVAPIMDSTAAVGIAVKYAREDHIHPTDTSRAAASALPVAASATPLIESGAGAVGASAKYAREDHVHPATPGGGTAGTITFTPAGNIAATDVQAAIVELDSEKVAKLGDTMTGNLIISKSNPSLVLQKTASGQANQLAGYNSANARWSLALGDNTAEAGSNAGSNFAVYSYTDAGGLLGTPLTIARANGVVDFKAAPTVNGVPIGGVTLISDFRPDPLTTPIGSTWFETDTGMFFVLYNDGNSKQWVHVPGGITDAVRYATAQTLDHRADRASSRQHLGDEEKLHHQRRDAGFARERDDGVHGS